MINRDTIHAEIQKRLGEVKVEVTPAMHTNIAVDVIVGEVNKKLDELDDEISRVRRWAGVPPSGSAGITGPR